MNTINTASPIRREIQWAGRTLAIELGRLAQQTNASAVVQYGDTVVLATVVLSKTVRESIDYFPLTIDYEERLYAAGKIKGSRFIKREGRPTDEAILAGRLVDRSIRPLFDERVRNDVQVVLTVLSFDGENDSDIPSLVAASLALAISDIPWAGPIAGIRVGRINNEWVLNPSYEARQKSDLDLVVAGMADKVLMIEAGAQEVSESVFLEAVLFGQKHMRPVLNLISEMVEQYGRPKLDTAIFAKEELALEEETANKVKKWSVEQLHKRFFNGTQVTKHARQAILEDLKSELDLYLASEQVGKEKRKIALDIFEGIVEDEVSRLIIEEGRRVDGRSLTEIRSLSVEVGVLPRTHGSALFSRGETQVLSVVTLGSPGDEQQLDTMEESGKKRYMHHSNSPPSSVGEVGRMGGAGRREIGHGALAEKALLPVLPNKEEFPYTVRVVSEVLSSNGSSSMASTCGSTLSLMDAGVPIKTPIAGIAMGLASDEQGRYQILTDLQDLEDGKGGMDFKVAGSADGITAVQLDTKTHGLSQAIVEETLSVAKTARTKILEEMNKIIAEPRAELSPFAPRIVTIHINPERIRDVIGPGGKVINEIIDKTGVASIDIEQDGTVFICSANKEGMDKAVEWVKSLTREVVVGEIYQGTVTRLMDFGAFVEILPKQEGLVHISELAPYRVNQVGDIVKVGQPVTVKVIEIDDMNRINLSMRQAMPESSFPSPPPFSEAPSPHRGERRDGPPRHRGSGGPHDRGGGRHRQY